MTRKCSVIWLTAVSSIVIAVSARATDINYPTLDEVVHDSTRIAVVEITDRSIANDMHDGNGSKCGVIYTARVIESIKGEAGTFVFLSPTDRDYRGSDRYYLVFVVAMENLTPTDSEELTMTSVEIKERRCQISSAPYMLMDSLQAMIPFEKDSMGSGDEMLRIERISPISTLPIELESEGEPRHSLVAWSVARTAIMEAVEENGVQNRE